VYLKGKTLFFIIFLFSFVLFSSNFAKENNKTLKIANILPVVEYANNLDTSPILIKAGKIEQQYGKRIKKYASIHEVNPKVVKAMMIAESEGDKKAKSRKNAMGLMQLLPKTAEMLNIKNPYDPDENIFGGTKYLKILIDRFGNDLDVVLVAYNAGPTKVEKSLQNGQNDFKSNEYVKKVKEIMSLI
jgi:soluble lytic murein transglycosylase-like protein